MFGKPGFQLNRLKDFLGLTPLVEKIKRYEVLEDELGVIKSEATDLAKIYIIDKGSYETSIKEAPTELIKGKIKERYHAYITKHIQDVSELKSRYNKLKCEKDKLMKDNKLKDAVDSINDTDKSKYTDEQKAKVARVMREFKAGKLKSSSGQVVTDHKQAVAIAMSEAGLSKSDGYVEEDVIEKAYDTIDYKDGFLLIEEGKCIGYSDGLFKAKDLSKLTKKEVWVKRKDGKIFKQTVYVKGAEEFEPEVGQEITPTIKGMDIERYSDKAIIIKGDTKSNVDLLRSIKEALNVGNWNRKLNGWIFPYKYKEEVLGMVYSDLVNKGEDEKAQAVQNQKNEFDTGTKVSIVGNEGEIKKGVSDSDGIKYDIKLKDGGELKGVDEKTLDVQPEIDEKKITETINNATAASRVKTEKILFGVKPIQDIHNYSLAEYMRMHGLGEEDIQKVIDRLKNPKKEGSGNSSGGGSTSSNKKESGSEGLTKQQLISKLLYSHYQAVKQAIEEGKEINPEVLELYSELKDAYDKKRKAMSEETKRKISEALKKNKQEEESPEIKKEGKESEEEINKLSKENYQPKDGREFEITSPSNMAQRAPVKLKTKDFTDIPALDIKIPKQKDILNKPKPYFIPDININQFKRNGHTLPAVKVGEDQYLVAINGFTDKQYYQFSLEVINNKENFAIMSLDTYAATQKYYQLKAKEELKQKEITKHQEKIDLAKKALSELDQIADPVKRENTKSYIERNLKYYESKKPKATRLAIYDKPDKMAQDQMSMIQAFNRNEDGNFVSKQEGWRIYREELFADRQQKQVDLDLQAEHDESSFTKGRETSYGDSGTKDTLLNEYGVKVKRQNGDEINEKEIAQIKEAMDNAAQVFGKNIEMNKKFGLKISHSGNVKMHAMKATGVFFPYYNAIGISNEYGKDMFNFVFGHEYAHFMDYWVGKNTGNHYASDKQGSIANEIARIFRRNMNKEQSSNYQNRTCECFARSLEMYTAIETKGENAIVWEGEKYFDAENYVNKETYETKLKPLIKQFLDENKDILKAMGVDLFKAEGDKLNKEEVKYVHNTEKGLNRCENCTFYLGNKGCSKVEGDIAKNGWCNLYRKKTDSIKKSINAILDKFGEKRAFDILEKSNLFGELNTERDKANFNGFLDIIRELYLTGDINPTNYDNFIEKARGGVYLDTPENRKLGRVGQKYGSKQDVENDLVSALNKIESEVVNLDYEHGYCLDDKGNKVFDEKGTGLNITISDDNVNKLKDNIFTHNHPSWKKYKELKDIGATLSLSDIRVSCVHGLKEIRCVSGNRTYSLTKYNGESFDISDFNKIKVILSKNYKSVIDKYSVNPSERDLILAVHILNKPLEESHEYNYQINKLK